MLHAFVLWAVVLLSNGQQLAVQSQDPVDIETCRIALQALPATIEEQTGQKVVSGQGMCLPVTSV